MISQTMDLMEIDRGFSLSKEFGRYSDEELCIAFGAYRTRYGDS